MLSAVIVEQVTRVDEDPPMMIRTMVIINGAERWKSEAVRVPDDVGEIGHVLEEQQTSARVWLLLTIRGGDT